MQWRVRVCEREDGQETYFVIHSMEAFLHTLIIKAGQGMCYIYSAVFIHTFINPLLSNLI